MAGGAIWLSCRHYGVHNFSQYGLLATITFFLSVSHYFHTMTETGNYEVTYRFSLFMLSYLGMALLLFACDYGGIKRPHLFFCWLYFGVVGIYTVIMTLIGDNLAYVPNRFSLEPGQNFPLAVSAICSFFLAVFAAILIAANMFRRGGAKHGLVFFFLTLALLIAGGFDIQNDNAWKITPFVAAVAVLILGGYTVLFRFKEWVLSGRSFAADHMPLAFAFVDGDGILIDKNSVFDDFFPEQKTVRLGEPVSRSALFEAVILNADLEEYQRNNTSPFLKLTRSVTMCDGLPGTKILAEDVSEHRAAKRTLDLLLRCDTLCGVLKRQAFFEDALRAFDLSVQNGTRCSILMIDVDHFKTINDTYGHAFGDTVLASSAKAAAARLRTTDIIGRYGGEEFVIFLPDTDAKGAEIVAESLRKQMKALKFVIEKQDIACSISVGIADDEPGGTLEQMVNQADIALYDAKHAGRDCVRIFSRI
jgi:diguanylate cyclase (GGDEF)-like protein